MTMLNHGFDGLFHPSEMRTVSRMATAHMAAIKRFCLCALVILLTGGALAGVIALKAAIYLARLNY